MVISSHLNSGRIPPTGENPMPAETMRYDPAPERTGENAA